MASRPPVRGSPVTGVLGVDPGAMATGLVLLDDAGTVVDATTAHRGTRALGGWVDHVLERVDAVLGDRVVVVGVEGVRPPRSHLSGKRSLGVSDPQVMYDTAAVVGAVLAVFSAAVVVPPGGNGKAPKTSYPGVLLGKRPRAFTVSEVSSRQHEWSAFDVARAALAGRGGR